MVEILSSANKQKLADAIAEAGAQTSAELIVVVAPASDSYQSYLLLYGFTLASITDIGLWALKYVTAFPYLFAVQLALMALFCFIPELRQLCLRLMPTHITHHRAAHRAYEEYLTVSKHIPASVPIALLYISVGERYAHILTSRRVRTTIPVASWDGIIDEFAVSIKNTTLYNACIIASHRMSVLLAEYFPPIA